METEREVSQINAGWQRSSYEINFSRLEIQLIVAQIKVIYPLKPSKFK